MTKEDSDGAALPGPPSPTKVLTPIPTPYLNTRFLNANLILTQACSGVAWENIALILTQACSPKVEAVWRGQLLYAPPSLPSLAVPEPMLAGSVLDSPLHQDVRTRRASSNYSTDSSTPCRRVSSSAELIRANRLSRTNSREDLV